MKWKKKKNKQKVQPKTKKVQTLENNWNIEFISGHPIIDISYLFNTYTYFLWENSLDSDLEQDFIFIKWSHLCFGCKRICNHWKIMQTNIILVFKFQWECLADLCSNLTLSHFYSVVIFYTKKKNPLDCKLMLSSCRFHITNDIFLQKFKFISLSLISRKQTAILIV